MTTAATDVFANGPVTVDLFNAKERAPFEELVSQGLATGTVSDFAPDIVYSKAEPKPLVAPAAVTAVELPDRPVEVSVPETASKPSVSQSEPSNTSSVESRPTTDQSEHRKALWMSRKLKSPDCGGSSMALLAALAVHNMIGVSQQADFGKLPEKVASSRIATETGMSQRQAVRAIAKAVELGYFKRVDNGKGGRAGSNTSAYVPSLPAWWNTTQV